MDSAIMNWKTFILAMCLTVSLSLLAGGSSDAATPISPPAKENEPSGTIAFSFYNRAGNRQAYEINIIHPDGSGRYIFPLDDVSEPALSPDGSRIAFRSWGTHQGAHCLATSRLDGSDFHCFTRFFEDASPDWTMDGRAIVFASQRESDRHWRMYTVWPEGKDDKARDEKAIGRADRQNLFGEDPSFAPDGWRVVYRGCDPQGNRCGLWIVTLDGQAVFPILEDQSASDPDWSPVDDQIVFRVLQNDDWDLWVVKADGSELTRLTNVPGVDALPAWSPDGKWIAFLSNRSGDWGIYIMRADGSDVRLVFAFDGGTYTPPDREVYGPRSWADEQISWSQ